MPIDEAPIDTGAMLIITDGGVPYAALNRSCRSRWSPPHDFRSRLKSAWARQFSAPVADLIGDPPTVAEAEVDWDWVTRAEQLRELRGRQLFHT
jgi:hypothetical protein